MNRAPVASPTTRAVTPVATEAPTEPDVVPSATVPSASRHHGAQPVGGEAVADHPHVGPLPAGIVDLFRRRQVADRRAATTQPRRSANGRIRLTANAGQPGLPTGKCDAGFRPRTGSPDVAYHAERVGHDCSPRQERSARYRCWRLAGPQTCNAIIRHDAGDAEQGRDVHLGLHACRSAAETPVIRLKPTTASVNPLISMAKPAISVGR